MKIAVCLFGHLRTYKHCIETLKKNLLDLYDCDVFMHTWSTIEHSTQTWHNDKIKENISILDNRDEIINLYNLKDLEIEEQEDKSAEYGDIIVSFSGSNVQKTHSIWGIRCLYHSILRSYTLVKKYQQKNNIKYDYILFIRPDILLHNPICIEKFVEDLDENSLDKSFFFTSLVLVNTRTNDIKKMHANDLIFFGRQNVIDIILNNIDNLLNEFYDGKKLFNQALESYKLEMVEKLGLRNWRIDYHMFKDYDILREKQIGKIKTEEKTKCLKHWRRFKDSFKQSLKCPIELASTLYYAIIQK